MGRNADKRNKRKLGVAEPTVSASVTSAKALVAEPALSRAPVPESAPASIADVSELLGLEDKSLSMALFRITCLLSVHDRHGVRRENLKKVAEEIASATQSDTVSLLLLQPGDDMVPARLVLAAAYGLAVADEALVTFDLGDGVAGRAAATGETLNIEDAPRDARFAPLYGQRTEIGSLLAVPLRYRGHVVGVVTASRREIRAFSPDDVERLSLIASSVAQDLEQSRLLIGAVIDPLTNLGSRLQLLLALPREVEVSKRYRTDLSVLVMDLDGLRAINEAHGRSAGDRVLVESAVRLRDALRGADLAVRLGGDELAVLLPMTSSNNARALAKRVARTLAAPVPVGAATVEPQWSIGTATLAPDEDTLGVLWRADEALQQAKAGGGQQIATAQTPRRATID